MTASQPQPQSPAELGEVILIQPATRDDLPGLIRLEQTCFAIPWSEASLAADLDNPDLAHYWVAKSATRGIVGYIACYQAVDTAQITNLAVLPDTRHRGIGQLLLAQLLAWAAQSQIATVDLEVRPSNLAAIHLYRKAGFEVVGTRRAYYADNQEDAHIMLKNIL